MDGMPVIDDHGARDPRNGRSTFQVSGFGTLERWNDGAFRVPGVKVWTAGTARRTVPLSHASDRNALSCSDSDSSICHSGARASAREPARLRPLASTGATQPAEALAKAGNP